MKLSIRLTISFLALALIPVAFFFIVSTRNIQDTVKDSVSSHLADLAKEKASLIDFLFSERVSEAKALAESWDINAIIKESNQHYAQMGDNSLIMEIVAIDDDWIEKKGRISKADAILNNSVSERLRRYQDVDPDKYGEIFVTDRYGAVVAMTKTLSDYRQSDEEWWRDVHRGNGTRVFIDDRGYDESIKALAVGVVVPVMDEKRVIGTLKINYKIKKVIDIVSSIKLGKTDFALLARSQGTLLAHSLTDNEQELSASQRDLLNSRKLVYGEGLFKGRKTVIGRARAATEIFTRVPTPGERKGISGEYWEPTVWNVLIEMEQEEAFAPARKLEQVVLWTSMAALVFIVVFSAVFFYFIHSILNPIKRLTRTIEEISLGRLETEPIGEPKGSGEIKSLIRAFNRILVSLKLAMKDLSNP